MITHALKFASREAALEALLSVPNAVAGAEGGPTFNASFVDADIPIEGSSDFHLNVALPALNTEIPGLIGAWDGMNPDGTANLLHGEMPETPQRVFA